MNHRSHASTRRRSFHDQQRRNAWRLRAVLLVYFLLALVAGRATGTALLHIADPDAYYAARYGVDEGLNTKSGHELFGYVNGVTLAVLLLAWVEYRRMRRRGDEVVLSLVDARPLKEVQLENTCAEMSIAALVDAPRMWIVETPELNAFSCARADGRASVALTRGLLQQLTREEIQAVVAHEIAHIRNGDTPLITLLLGLGRGFHLVSALALGPLRGFYDMAKNRDLEEFEEDVSLPAHQASFLGGDWTVRRTVLAVLATPFVAVAMLAVAVIVSLSIFSLFGLLIWLFPWLVCAYALWDLVFQRIPAVEAWFARSTGQFNWTGLLVFIPVGLVIGPAILVLGILVPIVLALMRLSVSRNREFQADATAVELTRNPDALRSALEKIRDAADPQAGPRLPHTLSALTIVPVLRKQAGAYAPAMLGQILDTHPSLEARIASLAQMGSPVASDSGGELRSARS